MPRAALLSPASTRQPVRTAAAATSAMQQGSGGALYCEHGANSFRRVQVGSMKMWRVGLQTTTAGRLVRVETADRDSECLAVGTLRGGTICLK